MSYDDEELKIDDVNDEEENLDSELELDSDLDDPLLDDDLLIEDDEDMPEEFAGLDGSSTDY